MKSSTFAGAAVRRPRHAGQAAMAAAAGALLVFGAAVSMPARAGADVGVSIGISQPGVYGRIDIGRFPQPQLVVQRPVYVQRPAAVVQPVYLWVPPGHRRHWRDHCREYGACNVPVYFVQDQWYHAHVAPPPRPRGYDRDRDGGRDDGRDHERGRDHDHDRQDGRGHGSGRGHDRD